MNSDCLMLVVTAIAEFVYYSFINILSVKFGVNDLNLI